LAEEGYDATPAGLKRALNCSDNWMKIMALRVIQSQKLDVLMSEVEQQITNPQITVRVEAGIALLALGNPMGSDVLHKEVRQGTALFEDVLSGKRPPLGSQVGDASGSTQAIRAAGALADAGDSSGFQLVKTALLIPEYSSAITALVMLPRFARFEPQSETIRILPLLLQAFDDSIKKIENAIAEGKREHNGPEQAYYMAASRVLSEFGGSEAIDRLKKATDHVDHTVREYGRIYLKELEKRSAPATPSK
jgi:hypothetical protein